LLLADVESHDCKLDRVSINIYYGDTVGNETIDKRFSGYTVKTWLTTNQTLALTLAITICFSAIAQAGSWWENTTVDCDFRYRHEVSQQEGEKARQRDRIRARISLHGKVTDYTTVGIRLATGSDNPLSSNQTLGDDFSTKQIGIDLAYLERKHRSLPGFTLTAGKFRNPLFRAGRTELIWDSDLNPEGVTLKIDIHGDRSGLSLIGAGLWVEERASEPNSYIFAGQAIGHYNFRKKKSKITLGVGLVSYSNIKGYQPFYTPDNSKGNTVVAAVMGSDTVVVYANDFELFTVSGELKHEFERQPLTLFAEYVNNTAADSLGTGWLVGVLIGRREKPGDWAFLYDYRNLQQDAVVGAFTDSNFRGGGTDGKGHEFGGTLMVAENTIFGMSYFLDDIGLIDGETVDYQRWQADVRLRF
jgi:hypothetical protein